MAAIEQRNMEERMSPEEEERLMKIVVENNEKIIKLQKYMGELQITLQKKKNEEEERSHEKEKEMDRWVEECRKRNEKEREEKEEKRRVDEEWRRVEKMRIKEERKAEKEWRRQEIREARREENRRRAMEERRCFGCGGFGHMASHCRNRGEEEPMTVSSNRFEVLKVRVMQKGEGSGKEVVKDRREILREEKAKRGVEKKKEEKKEKVLREVVVKIGLKQEEEEEGIVTEALLDSGATGLVMSKEFARKHKFRRMELERPVHVRNVDGTFNYAGPIVDTVEVEIFFKGHKERTSIDVMGGQKWGVILGMPWLRRHNPEINWRTGEVKMTRCPNECGKKWKTGRQMKPGWKKQEEREEKKDRRRLTIKEKKMIARLVEEKEEDLIELRATEDMVPRRFHKYLKVFEKKDSERMPTRKTWDHTIDLREGFMPKKGKIYPLSRVEREEVQEFVKDQLRKGYIRPSKSPQTSPVFFVLKKDGKKRMVQDYRYLNSWTIKNNYPLPLISDLIDSIGKKKVFTKMDLRWGYNNVRIKEGDEWKAAFSTPEGVKIVKGGLCSFLFSLFYFSFSFFFYSLFLFLEQLRLGVISHTVTSVTT